MGIRGIIISGADIQGFRQLSGWRCIAMEDV
jgi:hypothetical protein